MCTGLRDKQEVHIFTVDNLPNEAVEREWD